MKPISLTLIQNSPGQASNTTLSHNSIKQNHPFLWSKRWLKGDQYFYILNNIDQYCQKYGLQKYQQKSHPQSIYKNPISNVLADVFLDGLIYFVKGKGVGSDFGFPRLTTKKKYRWKKMNFTTDLPKKNPLVKYVVASALKVNINPLQSEPELKDYRMHAVILYNVKQKQQNQYILCHVRQVQTKQKQQNCQQNLKQCFIEYHADFYKLFAYLHNKVVKK